MRDLMAFLYLIFVCIAAYGVVSRALFMYDKLEFTAQNLFVEIFYRPYWFLYSIVDDEKNNLDGRSLLMIKEDVEFCLIFDRYHLFK
jgi:hypothetical protein